MLKALVVTDQYAVCDKCGKAALPDDPLLKIGHFVEWVTLHKTCFDAVVKGVEDLFTQWKKAKPKS